ncbi:iron ABC transporter substrate-binding protein [Litoribrevibacter euphylliae]|uniref:Iron ABC transporter substrate-binding protein n=1 Tax=Litoribrevibacter euphylliae TaxID=1834034 RepID=A0ABV7HKR4_9GAMM
MSILLNRSELSGMCYMMNLIRAICLFPMVLCSVVFAGEGQTVTDLAGREVVIPANVERIILGESRYIPALAILDEQPISKIVGMLADFIQTDPASYRQFSRKFPEIDDIPQIGHTSADSFSVEQVLTLNADVAIFGLEGHGPTARHAHVIQQLERAGVAIIFVDFRRAPLVNTPKSMDILGKVLGREDRAKAFNQFYQAQLQRVQEGLAKRAAQDQQEHAPRVFIHSRVGLQDLCCETMVKGMMASFADTVNGRNVAKDIVPGAGGVMNLEYLLTNQPDVYIATAIGSTDTWKRAHEGDDAKGGSEDNVPPYIVLGAGVSEAVARQSFKNALQASSSRGLQQLAAVKEGKAFAIWHHFYNTPMNVVAVQAFAKWLYPEAFTDLNPKATMAELFERFQPVPLNGTYWISLEEQDLKVTASNSSQLTEVADEQ